MTKRVRELGTLKALGWSQRLVVRQVTGEALAQGLLGGAIGVVLGIAGAALIEALAPSLEATVNAAGERGPEIRRAVRPGLRRLGDDRRRPQCAGQLGLVLAAVGLRCSAGSSQAPPVGCVLRAYGRRKRYARRLRGESAS